MGLLFSRFYEKPSTRDTLERIEQEIQNIEERRWDKIKREQFIVQILSFLPITVLIANACILIYPSDSTWRDKLTLSVPIAILNLVLWVCRKIVHWYSRWSLDNEEVRLRKLQKEKRRILDMVCETESYRVATELLEKYDPKQLRRRETRLSDRPVSPPPSSQQTLTKFQSSPKKSPSHHAAATTAAPTPQHSNPLITSNLNASMNQSISFPAVQPQLQIPAPPPPTPVATKHQFGSSKNAQLNTSTANPNTSILSAPVATSSVQGRPVRPILSKERTFFEKVVDWVVADGPENRFALICRFCYGHNGMCLAEEYETINFRCCYCYNLNTSSQKSRQVHDQLQPEREKSASEAEAGKSDDTNDKDSKPAESDVRADEEPQTSDEKSKEEESTKSSGTKEQAKVKKKSKKSDENRPLSPLEEKDSQLEESCDNNNLINREKN